MSERDYNESIPELEDSNDSGFFEQREQQKIEVPLLIHKDPKPFRCNELDNIRSNDFPKVQSR